MTYNDNKKKYNFVYSDSPKYRKEHGRIFGRKLQNDKRSKKTEKDRREDDKV